MRSLPVLFALCIATSALAQSPVRVDAAHREAIIEKVISELECCYIDASVVPHVERTLKGAFKAGAYDDLTMLAPFLQQLRDDMGSVVSDHHLGVWPIWFAPTPKVEASEDTEEWIEEEEKDNFGIGTVEVLDGNIGYLELTRFSQPAFGESEMRSAMSSLHDVSALIIDLRENHGGSSEMVNFVCGHFFDQPIHTISFYTRYTDETRELWTPAAVAGSSLAAVPLFVLMSERSASGAEHLAYALQAVGRAVIVGQRSRGAANPVEERVYPELSLNIALPVSRATHPMTLTSWEGTGVQPDTRVDAALALAMALRMARERE